MRIKIIVLLLCASFLTTSTIWANNVPPITAKIEILDVYENDHISVSLKFTLKNESEYPLDVLTWGTPFEGEFTRDTFKIAVNGERVPYIGKLVKRLAPTTKDFITIAGKGEVSEIVYLEDGYQIYNPGSYTVQYSDDSFRVKTTKTNKQSSSNFVELFPVQSGQADFVVNYGSTAILQQGFSEGAALTTVDSEKMTCTRAQHDAIQSAYRAASVMASNALQSLNRTPVNRRPEARRYIEWFGSYLESRYATVTNNFSKISNTVNNTIQYNCHDNYPDPNVVAYVFPSRPHIIYFCNAFWRIPLTGTDSKAGTIIHELTHFPSVVNSQDFAYSQPHCRNLAHTNPDAAIRNGDSYEYYAENTPPLSMPTASNDGDDDGGGGGGCFIQILME